MKNLIIVGISLLALAFLLYYILPDFSPVKLFEPMTLMGILAGIGLGLIIGGIVGYISKGSAMKEEQIKNELHRLRKENARKQETENLKQQTINQMNDDYQNI